MSENRIAARLESNGKWEECDFSELKNGDRFQLWDIIPPCNDRLLVVDAKGRSHFRAASDAFVREDGTEAIKIYVPEEGN